MGGRCVVKKFGWLALVSMLLVCALCAPGESWTRRDLDGQWQDFGGGWWYCWYSSTDTAYWKYGETNPTSRFQYSYTGAGQWWDCDLSSNWHTLGGAGAGETFVGDGAWHNMNSNSWYYLYSAAGDYGTWQRNGLHRFLYTYASGQWSDHAASNSTYWSAVGGSGVSSAFIGDGIWRNVNSDSWSYLYSAAGDYGTWQRNGLHRFFYNYFSGQWSDHAPSNAAYWSTVGGSGVSSAFIGDGVWHAVNNNSWNYLYSAAGDYGTWHRNGLHRFLYFYASGQWLDHASSNSTYWSTVGGTGVSSAFIGDGVWHAVNNNSWNYLYSAAGDYGTWHRNGLHRFLYFYASGQWLDHASSNSTYWNTVGGTGVSSVFIGDGYGHNLGNSWWYGYSSDLGSWYTGDPSAGGIQRFSYDYGVGRWWHYGFGGIGDELGTAGMSSSFVGDGDVSGHDLGNGWLYAYDRSLDRAMWWTETGPAAFGYDYAFGLWGHWSPFDGGTPQYNMTPLSGSGLSAEFVADITPHNLGNGWWYTYDGSSGSWYTAGGIQRFSYDYGVGRWWHYGFGGIGDELGTAGMSSSFVGDGGPHDIGQLYAGGPCWTYRYYTDTGGYGIWTLVDVGDRFLYQYIDGVWKFYETIGSGAWHELGQTGRTSEFIGDGSEYHMGYAWRIVYTGSWSETGWADTLAFKASDPNLGTWQEILRYNWYITQWEDHDYGTGGTGLWYGAGPYKLASGGASSMSDTFRLETSTVPNYSWHLYLGPPEIGIISTYFVDGDNYSHFRYLTRRWLQWDGFAWIDWGLGEPSSHRPN